MFGRLGVLTVAGVAVLVGCTSTVAGVGLRPSAAPDSANVALMDTGAYPTAAHAPYGAAGGDGALFEARRMGEYVVGPWVVDTALRARGPVDATVYTMPIGDAPSVDEALAEPLADVAAAHGFLAGFSSFRVKDDSVTTTTPAFSLSNAVLRFPGPDAAAAAVREMTDRLASSPPSRPVAVDDHPETAAWARRDDDATVVTGLSAYGPYVLYQQVKTGLAADPELTARLLVLPAVSTQQRFVDRFVPTDPAKLADLPKDPTGQLLARTLVVQDLKIPSVSVGVWPPAGWLHFEDDPVTAGALFNDAGVEWVSQLLATVYQTHTRDGAAKIVEHFAAAMAGTPNVTPSAGVPGLPGARCFERVSGAAAATDPMSFKRVAWHFKCVAQADRYAFTTFSDTDRDAKQQISAQYRILAGE